MKNKVVVVTGGAAGIGKATPIRFAEAGARVAICDVNAAGEGVAAALPGGRYYPLDVADRAAVQSVFEDLFAREGRPGFTPPRWC